MVVALPTFTSSHFEGRDGKGMPKKKKKERNSM